MQHTLVFFPDYIHANPYQSLLYSCVDGAFECLRGSINEALTCLQRPNAGGRTIFHLHWEDVVYRHLPDEDQALAEAQRFLEQLETFVDQGGLFLWTIHNQAPHDGRYLDLHRDLSDKLALLAHQIHVHSFAALAELEQERTLERAKITVVPHGNYCPIYRQPKPERPVGNGAGGRRFLLFGRLGRYKGGDALVDAFAGLEDEQTELVIAGKLIDPLDLDRLPAAVRERITVHNRYLDEDEVARVFAATDFMVAPYRASLTSGTVLLAMSMRQPVIAPRLPTLTELIVDGENGLLFAPGEQGALGEALARAVAMSEAEVRALAANAYATALRYDWRVIGNQLSGLLYRLVARCGPRRTLPPPSLLTPPAPDGGGL